MRKKFLFPENIREGQLLIEAIVGIGIFTIAVVGIIGLIARAVHEGRTVSNQFIAANLAAEGLEVTKNIIDSNVINRQSWNYGITIPGIYEISYSSTSLGTRITVDTSTPRTAYDSPALQTLYFDNSLGTYDYNSAGMPTSFKRYVFLENVNNSDYQIRAISVVLWPSASIGGGMEEISVATDFLNWR
ncbi:MAG: hypothetical protein M1153_00535 [Patescibacteria group bacterium]|nr:hypothetical protein [Patescibacteria group bacterium]